MKKLLTNKNLTIINFVIFILFFLFYIFPSYTPNREQPLLTLYLMKTLSWAFYPCFSAYPRVPNRQAPWFWKHAVLFRTPHFFNYHIQARFNCKGSLINTKSAHSSTRRIISVYRFCINTYMWNIIGPTTSSSSTFNNFSTNLSISSKVCKDYKSNSSKFSIFISPHLIIHCHRMTFWMHEQGLFSSKNSFDRFL